MLRLTGPAQTVRLTTRDLASSFPAWCRNAQPEASQTISFAAVPTQPTKVSSHFAELPCEVGFATRAAHDRVPSSNQVIRERQNSTREQLSFRNLLLYTVAGDF
jgi:hypothetical protein